MSDTQFNSEFLKALELAKTQSCIARICKVSQQQVSLYMSSGKMPPKRADLLVKEYPELDFRALVGLSD